MSAVVDRVAARLLPVDERDRVLLLRGIDPATPDAPYWFTIGGALEAGESPAQAAAREAWEEVGLRVKPAALGQPCWSGMAAFSFGGRRIRNTQDYFVVRVPAFQVSRDRLDPEEFATILGARWWPIAELITHQSDPAPSPGTAPVFPPELAQRLVGVLNGWAGGQLGSQDTCPASSA